MIRTFKFDESTMELLTFNPHVGPNVCVGHFEKSYLLAEVFCINFAAEIHRRTSLRFIQLVRL